MKNRFLMTEVNPKGYEAMFGLEKYMAASGLDKRLYELIKIRASQMNGCAFCIDMHTKEARKIGETEQRIYALNAWRETPYFTDEERATLALTEAITFVTEGHVSDEVYNKAREYLSEEEIAKIIMAAVTINAWNRIVISTRVSPS
ncbi:carboxymuconolactone decarboxylase family protein [Bacillus horti]|uniref:AhpD family alkylhydroperoxidase n=1 Tax=Caldalkalibacillus horti TaxID=77523 RepID=A0ABT9VXT3_9BACI|nr:carboxymuconolactone decarboxylase family protein [Bacillus horti]MDQ0165804.1 AhpD family alkylhydroperoxidase [Bacillus horti]